MNEWVKEKTLADAIKAAAGNAYVKCRQSVGGGDINNAYRYSLSGGRSLFIKTNRSKDSYFFEAEAIGLNALADTETISVPQVIAIGDDPIEGAFLIMQFIDARTRIHGFWEDFGISLANMHRADTGNYVKNGRYGFTKDNFIGSRRQQNTPHDSWVEFFRDCRLSPRLEEAWSYFDAEMHRRAVFLLDHLDKWITEPEFPSLLHGDLWSGNFIVGDTGRAWLIDPAVYVGDADADIAMTELFGGFDSGFYQAYRKVNPDRPGYEERKDIYNLYHLLNHLISFGRGYLASVEGSLKRYVG